MNFEWNEKKNKINQRKHGISFEETVEIFDDSLHKSILDKRFDYFEERWVTIGSSKKGRAIVVGHLYYLKDDGDEFIRIITARNAAKKERAQYETIGI